jgi:hypothetical protein
MDQNQAIEKARQFARTAYAAQVNQIIREHQQKLGQVRANLAARGLAQSGMMVSETARIMGEQIKAMAQALLDATLEGYELCGVEIDDKMATDICGQIMSSVDQMIAGTSSSTPTGIPRGMEAHYPQAVSQSVGLSPAWAKTQIDRRRLMAKKKNAPTTAYYVQGENARVNVNSTDHSVNIVMKSTEQFFGTIKQKIESGIPEGDERRKILDALTALQESHGKPTFAQRYTEFIAAAADYVTLLTPFIPQLTQMLGHVLK